jgi:ubiquinone/menaquinone biosynthesis C-methylase UbiE
MMAEPARYIFENAGGSAELLRLRALEAVFDPPSRARLLATGAWSGRHCLEVGAGAGSIAAWMQSQVGPSGRVVAVDHNVRFLGELPSAVEVIEGDIRELALAAETFDLVHARYVLIHNADSGAVLDALLECLKPGGWLVLEEPDFGAIQAFIGPEPLQEAFERVGRAILALFASRGMDPRFGTRLPAMLEARALQLLTLECDPHLEQGGASLAGMMRLSTLELAEKYVATGAASAADIDGYARFASEPDCWGVYYATFRALSRKASG